MQYTRILWLWLLVYLPLCSCPNPKKLFDLVKDVIFDEKIYLTNGRMSSLRDIFNFVPPIEFFDFYHNILPEYFVYDNVAEFQQRSLVDRNPIGPNVKNKLSGFNYIQRNTIHSPWNRIPIDIDNVVETFQSNVVFFLIGDTAKTGKTVEMAKIHESLIVNDPALWVIPVDGVKHFKKSTATEMTEQFLFDTVIDKRFKYLFTQVLKHSPRRIILLFDNVDYMSLEKRNALISIIHTLWQKKIRIIITGNNYFFSQVDNNENMSIYFVYLNPLNSNDKKKYLRNFWKKKMTPYKPEYNKRLDEYVAATVTVIQNNEFYQSFLELEIFAEEYTKKQTTLNHQPKNRYFDVGCLDYVLDQRPLPYIISAVFQDIQIDHMDLFDKKMDRLFQVESDYNIMEMKDAIYDYVGEFASKYDAMNFDHSNSDRTTNTIQEIVQALGIVDQIENSQSKAVIWFEDHDFFLARYIVKKIKSNDFYHASEDLHEIQNYFFRRQKKWYPTIEQLIDCKVDQLDVPNLMAIISPNNVLQTEILDKFIECRVSNMFDLVTMQLINNPNTAMAFVNYIQRDYDRRESFFLSHNLKVAASFRYENPSDFHVVTNRIGHLIEQNMIQLSPWVEKFPFQYLTPNDRFRIFEALIQNIATVEDVDILKKIVNDKFLKSMSGSMRIKMATMVEYCNTNVDDLIYEQFENIASFLKRQISSVIIDNPVSGKSQEENSATQSSTKLQKIKEFKNIIASITNVDDIHHFQNLLKNIDDSYYFGIGELLEAQVRKIAAEPISSSQIKKREEFLVKASTLAKTLKTNAPYTKWFTAVKCLFTRKTRTTSPSIPCFYGWNDVDNFNDAHKIQSINEIRVNSDKFLKTLAIAELQDHRKAAQLVDLIKYLEYETDSRELFTGKSKMRLNDVLRQKSLKAYRQIQRIPGMMKNILQQPSIKKSHAPSIPIKGITIYAAAVIPFIKGLYGTITTCLIETNGTNNNCLIGSGTLAVSTLGLAAGLLNPRYIHWSLEVVSTVALDIMPLSTPNFIRNNIRRLQGITLQSTAKIVHRTGLFLIVASLGFDIYNIVDMAIMIDMCSRPGSECLSKDKIDYIISLTFSAASLAITGVLIMSGASFGVGVIIGLVLLLVDMIAIGINEVFYYSNKYDTDFGENVNIFFNKIIGQSPSERVQSLARRADWVHILEQHVNNILESNGNIVAYGIGLGEFQGDTFVPSYGNINMAISNKAHASRLSRVIPAATNNTVLLCLPKEDKTALYEKYPNTVPGAEYSCSNSFVIAQNHRWNKTFDDTLYIIYDLVLIEKGKIVGSNSYNNLFSIYNSSTELNVFGGFGNITNHFKVQSATFRGIIFLRGKSLRDILDLSNVNSSVLYFTWHNELQQGQGQSDENVHNVFIVRLLNTSSPNLQVIGRVDERDLFSCDYHRLVNNQTSIIVDSRGGQSITNMDYVADCEVSVVRPFTRIVGSNSTNILYTAHVWLEHKSHQSDALTVATIEPRQSTFLIAFIHRPFFSSIDSIIYTPVNRTLNFIFRHTDSTKLSLSIISYHSGVFIQSNASADEIERANCIFLDSHVNTTITPIIHEPIDEKDIIIIRHFNILSTINSSRLSDVIKRFHHINSVNLLSDEFHIITKLNNPTTNDTFTIGSAANDRFLIESSSIFFHGGDGVDVYVLNRESSNSTWIDNEADDDALDTFVIPDTTCKTLRAETGSFKHQFTEASMYDVTLFCVIDGELSTTRIVLLKYLMESRYRHLQIYWHGALYSLLPTHWITKDTDEETARNIEMALVISFNGEFSEVTTVTLTTLDSYVLFNITDEDTNPFVAYKLGLNDVIIARQNFNRHSALVVVLQEFFMNGTDDIANDWLHPKIFKINGTIRYEDVLPRTLSASDIKKLYLDTLADNKSNRESSGFIEEYLINFTDLKENDRIVINHNNNVSMHGNFKLGVLAIVGAAPNEFNASWVDNNGTSLALCARQTCIHIKNWCKLIHRIQHIEFFLSLDHLPINVNNIDRINCKNFKKSLPKLNQKFIDAQPQLLLTDDNDNSRLIKCIGLIFSDVMTNSSMFELFGFTSSLEQRQFMNDNCRSLFTVDNLNNLSLTNVNEIMTQMVKVYFMKTGITSEEKEKSKFIQNSLVKLDSFCWQRFTILLIQFNDEISISDVNGFVRTMDEVSFILTSCLKNPS